MSLSRHSFVATNVPVQREQDGGHCGSTVEPKSLISSSLPGASSKQEHIADLPIAPSTIQGSRAQYLPNPSGSTSTATRHGSYPSALKNSDDTLVQLADLQVRANQLGIPSVLPKPPGSSLGQQAQPVPASRIPSSVAPASMAMHVHAAPAAPAPESPPPQVEITQFLISNYLAMLQQPSTGATPSQTTPEPHLAPGGNAVKDSMTSPVNPAFIPLPTSPAMDMVHSPYLTQYNNHLGDELMASPHFTDMSHISPIMDQYMSSPSFDTSPIFSDVGDDFGPPSLFETSPVIDFNSPYLDSPFGQDLSTPIMDTIDAAGLTEGELWPSLFNDGAVDMYQNLQDAKPAAAPLAVERTSSSESGSADSAQPSPVPALRPEISDTSSQRSRSRGQVIKLPKKREPTGTRPGLQPDDLLDLDAPIQPRKCSAPSYKHRTVSDSSNSTAASVSSSGSKRRKTSFGAPQPTGTPVLPSGDLNEEEDEEDRRKADRRTKNTLAARESRKRKLTRQLELEAEVDRLKRDNETWKTKAQLYGGMLKARGVDVGEI